MGAEETKATLAATTAKAEKLELALKKNQPEPGPARQVSMKSMFTQTVEEAKPRDVTSTSSRERLLAIMRRLRVSSDADEKSASKNAKEEQAGLGMLMGMFMGEDAE